MNGLFRLAIGRYLRYAYVFSVAVLAVLASVSCSSSHYRPIEPDSPPISAVDAYGVQNHNAPYVLQVGDTIQISFFHDSTMNQEVTIRPDGFISLPLIDDVEAAGMTPEGLDDQISEALAAYIKDPVVTVTVTLAANAHVFVGGEVRLPSMLPLRGKMTALQAIMFSGGFEDSAKVREVLLVRKSPEGTREIYRLNLKESMKKEESLDDVYLQAADLVIVPKKKVSNVNTFVDQYITGIIPLAVNLQFRYVWGKNYSDTNP